jgi:hypothetical protein
LCFSFDDDIILMRWGAQAVLAEVEVEVDVVVLMGARSDEGPVRLIIEA